MRRDYFKVRINNPDYLNDLPKYEYLTKKRFRI